MKPSAARKGRTFRTRNNQPTPLVVELQPAGLRMATNGTQLPKVSTVLP